MDCRRQLVECLRRIKKQLEKYLRLSIVFNSSKKKSNYASKYTMMGTARIQSLSGCTTVSMQISRGNNAER
jgi:hypothetical protein